MITALKLFLLLLAVLTVLYSFGPRVRVTPSAPAIGWPIRTKHSKLAGDILSPNTTDQLVSQIAGFVRSQLFDAGMEPPQ